MKPLLERKVQRNQKLVEWTDAAHHLTHDGQIEFMARMRARMAAADAARTKAPNVEPMVRKGRKA